MQTVCHRHYRNPVFCAIPPYILENLERKGNDKQRERARNTLTADRIQLDNRRSVLARFRQLRAVFKRRQLIAKWRQLVGAKTTTGQVQRSIYTANNGGRLPGQLVRREGQNKTGDQEVDQAYD